MERGHHLYQEGREQPCAIFSLPILSPRGFQASGALDRFFYREEKPIDPAPPRSVCPSPLDRRRNLSFSFS